MALGSLFLTFIIMSIAAIIGIVLLFVIKKEHVNDVFLVLLTAFSMTIAFLNATAQPTNFINQQILAWVIGVIALVGTGIRFIGKRQSVLAKVLVSCSVIGGMYFLYFG